MLKCKSCNKEIAFLVTRKNNKFIPVDYDSLSDEEKSLLKEDKTVYFEQFRHVSHFATCPFANKYRKYGTQL